MSNVDRLFIAIGFAATTLASLLLPPQDVRAAVEYNSSVSVTTWDNGILGPSVNQQQQKTDNTAATITHGNTFSFAQVLAGGPLRAIGVSVFEPSGLVFSSVGVNTSLRDSLTIGGGTGVGQFTLFLSFDGSLSSLSNASSDAGFSLGAGINNDTMFVSGGVNRGIDTGTVIGNFTGTVNQGVLSKTYSFTYGMALDMTVFLNISAIQGGVADYGSTLVPSFLLPAGAFITAESNAIYQVVGSNPGQVGAVPEPEIYAMMGVGLALLGWIKRKKKIQATV